MKKMILIMGVSLVAVSSFGYNYWTSTPEYSLIQIKKSIDTHNISLFQKHVDIDSVVNRAVDVLIGQVLDESIDSDSSGLEALGASLAAGMVMLMKPKIVEYATSKIVHFIEEGKGPQKADQQSAKEAQKTLSGVESFFSNHKEIKQSYLKKQENIAYLGIQRFDEKLKDVITLEFKLRKMDGYWQLVEVSNLEVMMSRIETLRSDRLAEINQPIIQRINQSISLGGFTKENREKNSWDQKVMVSAVISNNTNEVISELLIVGEILDSNQNLVRELNLEISELPIGKDQNFWWEFDINKFNDEDVKLFSLPEGKLEYIAKVHRFKLPNGELVALLTTL